jgi:Protein of unknown function (DUF1579)
MNGSIRSGIGLLACFGFLGAPNLVRGQGEPPVPKPTAEHERLAKDVGTWDATIKSWMQGPESESSVSEGVEVVKLMPGGLWIQTEFDGKFGDQGFHGAGHTGYDTKKGKYVGTWVDTMSTEIMVTEGDFDAASQTLTSHAKGTGPSGKPYEAKLSTKYQEDDTRVFTMSMKSDETKGEYVKIMEIRYKRRAK